MTEFEPQTTSPLGYRVSPKVGALVIEAARQLGAPIRKDAQSPEAFDRALIRLLKLAQCEINLHLYESAERYRI